VVVVAGAVVVVVATRTQAMSVHTALTISSLSSLFYFSISLVLSGVRTVYDVTATRLLAIEPNYVNVREAVFSFSVAYCEASESR
jgi:hypothetical protein